MYGNDSSDKLPNIYSADNPTPANWLWDVPTNTVNLLLVNGNERNMMYDPSFTQANNDDRWNFSLIAGGNLAQLRVTGYVPTFPDMTAYYTSGSHMVISNVNFQFSAVSIRIDSAGHTIGAPPPTDRTLVTCAILSADDQINLAADSFNAVAGLGGGPSQNQTSHLSGIIPAGGNHAMLDGHVEWDKFSVINPASTKIRSNISGVYFWW